MPRGPAREPQPVLAISVFPSPLPLEEWAKLHMPLWVQLWTDIKVLSDKPSQLKDGTPAWEVEFEFVSKYDLTGPSIKNSPKYYGLELMTKKDLTWVTIWMSDDPERIGEDLQKVAHSLTFQPDREKPVGVPPDVRAFLDMYRADMMGHDVKAFMEHFSDRFHHSGGNKKGMELWFQTDPNSPARQGLISFEPTVTVFEPRGEKAYIDGFYLQKAKGDTIALKAPMMFQQIINEHGQWKWYGDQK